MPAPLRSAFVLLLLTAPAALAQDGPSFDCAKAQSEAEKLICTDPALAALDRRMTDRFAAAVDVAKGLDVGAKEAEDELRAYQRGWVKGRDECWKADDQRACVEGEYLRREAELVARFMLEQPTATVFWACENNPANQVVTAFFDTELPAVRIERGDTTYAGWLTPAASGSRYEAPFGLWFWTKGDEATAMLEQGAEITCRKFG